VVVISHAVPKVETTPVTALKPLTKLIN